MDQKVVGGWTGGPWLGVQEPEWAPRYIWLQNAVLAKSQERALVDSTGKMEAEKTSYHSVSRTKGSIGLKTGEQLGWEKW